jgi:hypothetical protein
MRIARSCIFSVLIILTLIMASCVAKTGSFGEEISNRKITPIGDILANPGAYEGKVVTVEGKITNECPSGCWFFVQMGGGNSVIYVDTKDAGFAIPQYIGRNVTAEGTVVIKESRPMVRARGVEIR